MSKLKTILKRPAQLQQRVFGFLPVISFGGMALILGVFAIAPNFMNFAHAEENPALKPSDIKLSISVDKTFRKFNDVYLTSDGVEQEAQNNVTFIPTVETNNPAGYKVYFSDVDEDTDMRSIDATVTDSIRSATPSDFENGEPKNTSDNYWYCGILQVPNRATGEVEKVNSTNNDFTIPVRSYPRLIDEVKYVKPNDNKNNGVFCNISVNKQLVPSTYVGKMIFSTLANVNNLKPATLKDGYSAFRRIPNNFLGKREFKSFKYAKPTPADFSTEVENDETITSNIKPDYKYQSTPPEACPPTFGLGFAMYNLTANNTDDEEPVLVWASSCDDKGLRWWSPSGTLKLGANCSNFFSAVNAPRFDNLDLSGIDISNCKNMESMFERTDEGFKKIDFGNNQFSSELNNTKKMFKGNANLEEIKTNHDLDLTYVPESSEMFEGNTSLVGSYYNNGCVFTEYNTVKNDGSMAKTVIGYFHRTYGDDRECVKIKPGQPSPGPQLKNNKKSQREPSALFFSS